MMKLKRLSALVLAILMVALVGAAFATTAADMDGEAGVIGEFETKDTPVTQADTVKIYKEITAYNPESCEINAPTINYNYTIGAATVAAGTTVTDNASRHEKINNQDVNVEVAVKAGVGTPTITGTGSGVLAITPSDQLNASEYGTANRFELTVDFSSIDWAQDGSGAGVYRYVINETTTTATKNVSGIDEGTFAKTLYMDVYVDGSGNIYGYVLFTTNDSIDGSTSEATAATAAGKIEGFVDDADDHVYSDTDVSVADKYYTFNFDVKKVVVNDSMGQSHQFPFTVTFANTTVTADVLPIVSGTGTYTLPTISTADAIADFVIDGTEDSPTNPLKLAHNGTASFVGIPCGTTVTITEKNDVTGVTYQAVITNADTNGDAKAINTGDLSNDAVIDCNATALTAANENHTAAASKVVTFTNTLLQISPTGLVVRFAPYGLLLIGGVALLLIAMKHRKHSEEE